MAWRDKDRADVAQLLRLHGRTIDLDRVRKTAAEFAEALEEPERLAQLERLLTSLDEP